MLLSDARKKVIRTALWGSVAGVLASYGLYWCFPYEQSLTVGLLLFLIAPLSMKLAGERRTFAVLTFLTFFGMLGLLGALGNWGLAVMGQDRDWIGPAVSVAAFVLAALATRRITILSAKP